MIEDFAGAIADVGESITIDGRQVVALVHVGYEGTPAGDLEIDNAQSYALLSRSDADGLAKGSVIRIRGTDYRVRSIESQNSGLLRVLLRQ